MRSQMQSGWEWAWTGSSRASLCAAAGAAVGNTAFSLRFFANKKRKQNCEGSTTQKSKQSRVDTWHTEWSIVGASFVCLCSLCSENEEGRKKWNAGSAYQAVFIVLCEGRSRERQSGPSSKETWILLWKTVSKSRFSCLTVRGWRAAPGLLEVAQNWRNKTRTAEHNLEHKKTGNLPGSDVGFAVG